MKKQAINKSSKSKSRPDTGSTKKVFIREGTTLKDLSNKIGVKSKELIECINSKDFAVNINDIVNTSILEVVSKAYNLDIKLVSIEEETRSLALSNPKELIPRPPVVTIMGHVDHGKTTLLDAIRKSNIVGREFGGITQHIGAYRIKHNNRYITFIDTPGHEAFTKLRSRGAKITDIVVLIVAADDGVMPQTKEAVDHAKAANVPIIVAINKTDKPEADVDKVKQQLSKEDLLVEEWGGDTVCVEISAKEKKNLDELLEMILLLSDVIEIKANPNVKAHGIILEARLDAKKGPLATVIIEHGTLTLGEAFVSGLCYGKVRAIFDEYGKPLKKVLPSMPAEILGFYDVPVAGDFFQAVSNIETAKNIVEFRNSMLKKEEPKRTERLTLDQLFKQIEDKGEKELPIIIKADVQGSVEVLKDLLPNLSNEQVKIKIIHSATGNITESDVNLASASNAIIIGYNTKASQKILEIAKKEQVDIRIYNVIYKLTDDIKKALIGLLEPTFIETYLGKAVVRRVFNIPRIGVIAGCYVTDGKIVRNAQARIIRDNNVIHTGRISSLKHLKENVTEIKKEYECGIGFDKFKDIQEGDIIEAFIIEKES